MNTYEMEGFLRGQCVPRDLLVNESNAEYLVRKLSEIASVKADRDALAERVNALAVENACLVRAITDHKNSTHFCERCGEDDPCATDDVCSVLRGIPDTDSAIAAFEAQGVEKAAAALDALSAQSASATTQANFRAAAVYLRTAVLPVIGEAK